MLCNRQVKKAILIFSVVLAYFIFRLCKLELSTFFFIYFSKASVVNLKQLESVTTGHSSSEFRHAYYCPTCFGYSICRDFIKGSVLFYGDLPIAHNPRITWRKSVLELQRVVITSPSLEEWNKFDEFVCRNASMGVPCDISSAVWKTVLATENFLAIDNFRNLNALLDVPLAHFSLPVCATEKFVDELAKSFDENADGLISEEEKILLLTSLIMQPGYAILKLQARTRMSLPIPNLHGACGRSIIIEGGLKSLTSYLSQSFDIRAGLAVQVLQLVEDFEEEDPQWYFLYFAFSLDAIVVTSEGELIAIDLDNLVVIDKSFLPSDTNKLTSSNGLCNEICFQKITLQLLYNPSNTSCSFVSEYGQLMYAIACKQVLSNIDEHKVEGFFNFDGHRIHKKLESAGLLHSIPIKAKEKIENLLRECVQETKPNGRRRAVAELRDVLESYVKVKSPEALNADLPRSYDVTVSSEKHLRIS
ncbi:LOW QUALITY PROTEIN: uncharacterized protein LOC129231503 [Uloborus diversus]|uniref:LOW QUALITY PROTEIN: uncharacterized protein LOC129231503 n=1 Tax=Uloborus diversus TaxID=327109 RepID=UPI002409E6D1|nr:LOW QUALITY PROTEIN: uncharacterized protein LOC129231503 [Uloborus diversus]